MRGNVYMWSGCIKSDWQRGPHSQVLGLEKCGWLEGPGEAQGGCRLVNKEETGKAGAGESLGPDHEAWAFLKP